MKNLRPKKDQELRLKKPDKIITLLTFLIAIFGLIMVYDSSLYAANANFKGDTFRLVSQQFFWFIFGSIAFIVTSYLPYKFYRRYTLFLFIITILLLIYTLFTADASAQNGAKRWASLAGFSIQGSELAKLTFILYLASWLSKQEVYKNTNDFIKKNLMSFGFILLIVIGLVAAGRDLSTTIIIGLIGIVMYVFNIKERRHLLAFLSVVGIVALASVILISTESFRLSRFQTYISINTGKELSYDELTGSSYQTNQSLIGIGSGGFLGKGFTKSDIKYSLPETVAATDAIFAVFAEEFGFLGSFILILIYFALFLRIINVTNVIHDNYARLIVIGVVTWLGSQTFFNIGGNISLIPEAGMPLPLISYGGSSLLMAMTALGITCNISRYANAEALETEKKPRIQPEKKKEVRSHKPTTKKRSVVKSQKPRRLKHKK